MFLFLATFFSLHIFQSSQSANIWVCPLIYRIRKLMGDWVGEEVAKMQKQRRHIGGSHMTKIHKNLRHEKNKTKTVQFLCCSSLYSFPPKTLMVCGRWRCGAFVIGHHCLWEHTFISVSNSRILRMLFGSHENAVFASQPHRNHHTHNNHLTTIRKCATRLCECDSGHLFTIYQP